jgi:hypothetical protein
MVLLEAATGIPFFDNVCRQLAAAEGRLLHAEERIATLSNEVESLQVCL